MEIPRDQKALEALASRIRLLRTRAGISQEQLALQCDINRTYISKIERGAANPSFLILVRISSVLEVPLIELLMF